jgi:hypothetical protein
MPVARLQAAMALAFAGWSGRRRLRQLDHIVGAQLGRAERLGPMLPGDAHAASHRRPERNGGDADIAHLARRFRSYAFGGAEKSASGCWLCRSREACRS